MKRTIATLTFAATFTLSGAAPALAAAGSQSVDPQGGSTAAGGSSRAVGLTADGSKKAATTGLAGFNDPASATGIVLWSLAGGGALVAGATSVVVVRRRAKTEAYAA